ncbi:MAG: PAS domain S-box protein [Polyangiaceae bacterium]|nr:PAS domain S-box protein [Polyangiaceae bacterium]
MLVVDDDAVSRHVLTQALERAQLEVVALGCGREAIRWLKQERPALVLLDLLMPEPDGYEVLRVIRDELALPDLPVVVLTGLDTDEDIRRIFASGADDYIHKPFRAAELIARIRGQLRMQRYVEELRRREQRAELVLELTYALGSSEDIHDILFQVVDRLAQVAKVDRCSIVLSSDDRLGYVVATSDDRAVRDLPIELDRYPEIREVLATGKPLVIQDATSHPLLEVVRREDTPITFASLTLVPLTHEGRALGVLFLRSKIPGAAFEQELETVRTLANATALSLQNARVLKSLRDETEQSTHARVEAEQRVQQFQRYADFFESAADGMVVIDGQGKVLFANSQARAILAYSEREFKARSLMSLTAPNEHARVERLMAGFREGAYPLSQDLDAVTQTGEVITLSVNFSSVLHEDDAVLFSFRDVTSERRTERELRQTKEFLERVIDSSVDAIVSADLSGRVLIFNRAASRVFGYPAEDIIGKASVEIFYPPGVAREVMRQIRSADRDDVGRLENYRVDMVSSSGELIQVKLSAALLLENGEPVGSVGVFTDLRDRLRMETKLGQAQEELRLRERQAIVAELAGTAAHELNQPLTSVIGYAELLRRHLDRSSQLFGAASVIVTEAERMAEIVRKIGKITRYETKSYVGGTRILDLDKSSDDRDR